MIWQTRLTCRLARAYAWLIAYFSPTAISRDREAKNQAQMFLISHLFGPFLGNTVPLALWVFDPTPGYDILILAASITGFWVFPFLLRAGVAYSRLVILSIVNLNFAVYWSCFFYGGIASPTLTWILVIPILSIFYIGSDQRLKPHLLAISSLSFVLFAGAYITLEQGTNDLPAAAQIGLGATSTVATLCYVAAMAIYYARIFDAGVDLENEVRRRKRMAIELREAVVAANRASASKSEFLARMSHELRTPLNAIIGYGELLKEEAEDENDEDLLADLDRILDAGRYLVRLINMVLDLSKLEAGRMEFDARRCRPADTIRAVAREREDIVGAGGNRLELNVDPALDVVEVDENRLHEILDSIIENAAQHTSDGVIMISAYPCWSGGEEAFAITVSDTGTGIPPDILPTIFETFSTPRDAAHGQYGGTGLNLTLSRRLCRAMGGDITVRSAVGVGSTFVVTLPARPRSSTASDASGARSAA